MRIKLTAILILALSTVALVGYISYVGLQNLMNTLEETVQPDYREKDIQTLLYHISEAENSIRIFTITRESRYLRPYYSNNKKADSLIQYLDTKSKNDLFLSQHLDTISQLLNQKTNIQKRLIRLKRDQNRIDVYEEVLTKIQSLERKNALIDSLKNAIENAEFTLEKEIQEKEKEIEIQEEIPEEEKKGFFKRLFGTNKKEEEQLVDELDFEKKSKELDTLLAAKDTLDTIIDTLQTEDISKEIERSIAEIKIREENINKELTIIELRLTRRDKALAYRIQLQIELLQTYFNQLDVGQAKAAASYFNKTTRLITIIGSTFSMLFLMLIFVVMNDFKINQRNRKELEIAKRNAEQLALAKEEFLSNMSHEIRTPMNAILGFAEQLQESDLNEQYQKQAGIIYHASQHLLSIINDILDYAKIDAGKIKLDNTAFSVKKNAQIVYDTLYKKANDKNLDFSLEIGDDFKDQFVTGDPLRFRQIIFNLADNAIKFTEIGFVKITIEQVDDKILLKVMDSGIGIEDEQVPLIFNKFDQAHSESTKKYGGTGLGLAIVKKLVEMQNGTITVKSKKDFGTEFKVKLPFVPATSDEDQKEEGKENHAIFSDQLRVLLVDDEEYNLLLIQTILDKYSISYQAAKSGNQALEMFDNTSFNLVLMDIQMDDLNGFETTKLLREKFKTDIPIIAFTATATGDIEKKCHEAGMNDVLIKPISENDLLACINQHFSQDSDINSIMADENIKSNNTGPVLELTELSSLLRLFHNDKDQTINMTSIYINSLVDAISSFKNGMELSDFKSIRNTAHKIIPSSRHMGFSQFADQLKQVELSVEMESEKTELEDQLTDILSNADKIIDQLRNLLSTVDEKINLN